MRLVIQAKKQMGFNLISMADSHRELTVAAMAVLERVRLDGLRDQTVSALSHGNQRKLEVALLIALDPMVYMFDEPTAGMSVDEAPVVLDLIAELKAGQLDTAILALPVSEPAFNEIPLFEEPFVLVRPGSDADKPVPDREDLREMQLLLLEEGHCFRDQALSFCEIPQNAPRELLDASSLSTLVQMVNAGIGVTLLPEMAVPIETRSAKVDVARFPAPQPQRTIGMVWRRNNPMAEKLSQIAGVVTQAADR